ncbi:alpha/beta hydrolase [Rheinheimera sediminis]|uniref:alpha/beta hydrolase n=1 Tax=Rheinheimera sp. YQF-1 TaxID=2499626 RepID=UPI001C96DFE1|nr:alpha/beta hydrolase [Rheinheimera sp. YQF-1]
MLWLLWIAGIGLLSACAALPPAQLATDAKPSAALTAAPLYNVSFNSVLALPVKNQGMKLAYGTAALQFGLLSLPATQSGTKPPLVIFVHGGCWLNAYDVAHSKALSQALTEAGYAVWSLEYRRVGDEGGGWPGSFNDIVQGINYAQAQFEQYGVDVNRIALMGHSAGGQLALLAGKELAGEKLAGDKKPAPIQAVIGLAAITDMASYAKGSNSCQSVTAKFIGASPEQAPALYQDASPSLHKAHPNTLLLQGSADSIVPATQATDSGIPYLMVEKAGHFDWIHPQSAAYPQLILTLQELLPL